MIAGFFGNAKLDGSVLNVLASDSAHNQRRISVVEENGIWGCFISDFCSHLDPPYKDDNMVAVTSDPIFVGSLEEGYRRAKLAEWARGLSEKGVIFFREVINNVCVAAIQTIKGGTRLHLVSHRLGPGRIYYRLLSDGVIFSSDAKALAKALAGIAPVKPDPMGLWSIIVWGAVPEPLSVFEEVHSVPVGQAATFTLGSTVPVYTPILKLNFKSDDISEKDCLAEVRRPLLSGARLIADLGASMTVSGGIDSSLFLCLMQNTLEQPRYGYVCSFSADDSEIAYAHQIAGATNTSLKIFELSGAQATTMIRYAAENAMHPFSDFSSVPVAFLFKHIAEDRPDCPWIFDGNGGDDCFGVAGQEMLGRWQRMTKLPALFHRIGSYLWLQGGLWKNYGMPDIVMRKLYQASVHDAYLAPFLFGHAGMTHMDAAWSKKIQESLRNTFTACTGDRGDNFIYSNFYVAQLLHVCSRLWTAKALGPAQALGKTALFPYLWRDVLNSMGKIPWQLKVRNCVAKWPLKKMLEDFMPKNFIYRPKSGYVPPLRMWLRDKRINRFTRESLLGGTGYITSILKEKWIEQILRHLKETNSNPPAMVLNTIWGALATELWLQKALG